MRRSQYSSLKAKGTLCVLLWFIYTFAHLKSSFIKRRVRLHNIRVLPNSFHTLIADWKEEEVHISFSPSLYISIFSFVCHLQDVIAEDMKLRYDVRSICILLTIYGQVVKITFPLSSFFILSLPFLRFSWKELCDIVRSELSNRQATSEEPVDKSLLAHWACQQIFEIYRPSNSLLLYKALATVSLLTSFIEYMCLHKVIVYIDTGMCDGEVGEISEIHTTRWRGHTLQTVTWALSAKVPQWWRVVGGMCSGIGR